MYKLPGPLGEVPSCAISAIAEAASSIQCGEGQGNTQVSETNSENVKVGKRVAEYNAPTKWSVVVEFSVHRSLQVQYTKPIVWVWHSYTRICEKNF